MNLTEISTLDKYVFLFLNGKHSPFFDFIMHAASNMLLWLPLYAVILFCTIKFFKNTTNRFENTVLTIVMIITLALICGVIFPPVFDALVVRLTPCHNPSINAYVRLVGTDCGDDFGFFAQRSCFAFALVTYIFLALPRNFNWLKFILVLWAVLISYSRVYVGVHYPLNVLSAGVIGIVSGIFVFKVYDYFKNSLLLI